MRLPFSDALFTNARPTVMRWSRLMARVFHFCAAVCPAVLVLWLMDVRDAGMIRTYLLLALSAGVLTLLVFAAFGLYGRKLFSNRLLLRATVVAWSAGFGLVLLLHTLFHLIAYLPVKMAMLWYATTLLLLVVGRLLMLAFFQRRMRQGDFVGRSVIVGATENGGRLARHMQQNAEIACGLLGFIDDRSPERIAPNLRPQLIGNFTMLERLIRNNEVDQVLMALPAAAEGRNRHYVELLRKMPVQVFLVPEMQAFNFALPRVANISDVPMLVVSEPPLKGWAPAYKRAEDIVLAGLALVLLAPLMLAVAVAIKLDSRGPVLFRQRRYGYNQQLIEVYKFRSMYHHQRDMDARTQTRADDPRVTRVGRLIRRTSIDELPQLFNVLGGSMSLVGPRPHATATKAADILFEEAVADYVARHKVKPGITGLAQVHGYRGETDTVEKLQKRVEYDLAYIENWSLGLDAFILLRTLPAVLSMKAAY
ncbi:undecaprenyl-phosphate glucose phosphotransferase [Stenotrophomonas mori]|uniref:Undecaprenyl-phosphate glucose phosphotransferase n=1 Tax=Stenotrophomonas mori TaxID=2871096 RepID=A0ABT0SJQ9_9GAMM|nr:undecaprenyl-phosphate glucose phosphotransferase [Stenotrophomonas mori]MCL7715569.1 undecaprenyl-phosphate glucose phosphotransferase [Stenotrophomonas mori]